MKQAAAALSLLIALFFCSKEVLAVVTEKNSTATGASNAIETADDDGPRKKHPGRMPYKADEILVKFKPDVSEKNKDDLHNKAHGKKLKEFRSLRLHHVKLEKGISAEEAIELYQADPDVEYAEPDFLYSPHAVPNDPSYSQLWGMAKINAPAAWDSTTGNSSVVVAVIDSGADYNHPDLAANIWLNPGEIAGNGVDDDGNGYVDDIHGISPLDGTTNVLDPLGHGSHVAGTIGAVGNNALGVTGVNWNVKILPCKIGSTSNNYSSSAAIACLQYVKALKATGVNIVATNNSWGGPGFSQSLYDAINAQQDILFIASAGNDSKSNDTIPDYPSAYKLPNVVSVAATGSGDLRASFSNYGRKSVQVAAPGETILSTTPGGNYENYSGTSMAAPHVAGLAALIKSGNLSRTAGQIKNLILSAGDPAMAGVTLSGKRINAYRSLNCTDSPLLAPIDYPSVPVVGTAATVSALSVNCANPVAPVTMTTLGGQTVTLHDDGVAPDTFAGDGIYSGSWTPSLASEKLTFTSPAGTVVVPCPTIVITTNYLHEANTHVPYSDVLKAEGGKPPYTWTITGGFPPGLTLNPETGEISGGVTSAGSYAMTATATDTLDQKASINLTMRASTDSVIELWGRVLDYGKSETTGGVILDGSQNLYVAGDSSYDISGGLLTLKYDSAGNLLLKQPFIGHGYYSANDIAQANDQSIYIAGYYFDMSYNKCLLMKYNPSGALAWYRVYTGASCNGVTADSANNAIFVGYGNNAGNSDASMWKVDPNGNVLWNKFYDRGGSENLYKVVVDGSGNIYAAGTLTSTTDSNVVDGLIMKFDSTGNTLWSNIYDTPGRREYFNSVALDPAGSPVVIGTTYQSSWVRDFLLAKYDPAGNLLWLKNNNPTGLTRSGGSALAVDRDGYIFATGTARPGSYYGAATVKYTPSGDVIWSKVTQNGTGAGGAGIAVDGVGNVYVGGFTSNATSDIFTLKYFDPPLIITSALPTAYTGEPYSQSLTGTGGRAPYSWTLTSGALPSGLTLGSSGLVSGTATTTCTSTFTVQFTDADGNIASKVVTLAVTVPPLVLLTDDFLPGITGASYSQTVTAKGGVPAYTWSLLSGILPGGLALAGSTGVISGTPNRSGVYSFTARVTDTQAKTADKPLSITVSDTACSSDPVRISGAVPTFYPDFLSAYLSAVDQDLIQFQALDFSSEFYLDRNIRVKLQGGHDCGFTSAPGSTGVLGKLRVKNGTASIDRLVFR